MAKRKKHHKKKQAQRKGNQALQANVVIKSTTVHEHPGKAHEVPKLKPSGAVIAEAGSEAEATYVRQDVRYSLILIAFIAVVFVVLFLLLQNSTVSNTVYGLIKLPNIGQ